MRGPVAMLAWLPISALAAFAFWMCGSSPAAAEQRPQASPWKTAYAARLRLIGSGAGGLTLEEGQRLAALQIELEPNWKTYWRMPGEAGVAPEFDWSKSSNVQSVTVLYPAPRRYPDQGGDAIGYSQGVTFPLLVTPKEASEAAELVLDFTFGICRDICIPLEVGLRMSLPPLPASTLVHPLVSAALEQVPQPAIVAKPETPRLTEVSGSVAEAPRRLTLTTASPAEDEVEVFVEAPDGLFVPLPVRSQGPQPPGTAVFVVDLARSYDAMELVGKPLRITVVGRTGASETIFTPEK